MIRIGLGFILMVVAAGAVDAQGSVAIIGSCGFLGAALCFTGVMKIVH